MPNDWNTPPTPEEMAANNPRDPWGPPTPEEMAAGMANNQPGPVGRLLRWLTTPSQAMQPIIEQNKATQGSGIINKDSPDWLAGVGAAVSGIPGFQHQDTSPDFDEREQRFRKEHSTAAFLLPLAAGFAKPGALPAAVAPEASAPGLLTRTLEEIANKAGRRTLYGGANGLSERYPVTDASIEAAHNAGAFRPFGTTRHAADVLSDALDEAGAVKGDVVKQMEAAGIKGPDAPNLAQLLRAKAAYLRKNTAGSNLPDLYEKVAADIEAAGEGGRLGVQQAENIKTSLQKQAKYGRPEETLQNIEKRKIASTVRQGIEDASAADAATLGGPAADANAALIPSKQQFALLAPAAKAAEKGLSQSLKRNAFGLRETIMAAPMAASHGLGAGASMGLLTKALSAYGPSTLEWGARGAANMSRRVLPLASALMARGVPQDLAESIAQSQANQ